MKHGKLYRLRSRTMKDQRVVGKRKNNPLAKQLSDPLWRKRVVTSKVVYNRKKVKDQDYVDHSTK